MVLLLRGPLDERILELVWRQAGTLFSGQFEHGQSVQLLQVRRLKASLVSLDYALLLLGGF